YRQHGGAVRCLGCAQSDAAARRGVLQCVGQQIAQRPSQQQRVGQQGRIALTNQLHALLIRQVLIEVHDVLEFGAFVQRHSLERQSRLVRLGEKQHAVDHAGETAVLLEGGLQNPRVLSRSASSRQSDLSLANQVVDRSAQLV